MKKVYIAPATTSYKIDTQFSLLNVSGSGTDVNSVDVSSTNYDSSKGSVLGRGGFFDDSED
ncbi:MAG: hypothetical protein IJ144_02935 [Prevotella sp.]|nr:hypothetical protein [Prevotella sp.]